MLKKRPFFVDRGHIREKNGITWGMQVCEERQFVLQKGTKLGQKETAG